MRLLLTSIALLIASTIAARADRPVTEVERAQLAAAITALGCIGGTMEWDDDDKEFEVEDVQCADGRTYDLTFNPDFTLKSRELDD